MKKGKFSEGILTSIFKWLFGGKVSGIESMLENDPELKARAKSLAKAVDEMTSYYDEHFGDYDFPELKERANRDK